MGLKKAATAAVAGGVTGALANLATRPGPVEEMTNSVMRMNDGTTGHIMTGTGKILNQAAIDAASGQMPRDVAIGAAAGLATLGVHHLLGRQFKK